MAYKSFFCFFLHTFFSIRYQPYEEIMSHALVVIIATQVRQAQFQLLCGSCKFNVHNLSSVIYCGIWSGQMCPCIIKSGCIM